jgi:hypothetical protein
VLDDLRERDNPDAYNIAYPIAEDMNFKKEMIANGTKEISTEIIDKLGGGKMFTIDNLIEFISSNALILNTNVNRTFQIPGGVSPEEYNKTFVRAVFNNKEQMLITLVPVISDSVIQIITQNKGLIQKLQTDIFTDEFMDKYGYKYEPISSPISFFFVPSKGITTQDFSDKMKEKLSVFNDVTNVGVTANFCEFSGSISEPDNSNNIKKILTDSERILMERLQEQNIKAISRILITCNHDLDNINAQLQSNQLQEVGTQLEKVKIKLMELGNYLNTLGQSEQLTYQSSLMDKLNQLETRFQQQQAAQQQQQQQQALLQQQQQQQALLQQQQQQQAAQQQALLQQQQQQEAEAAEAAAQQQQALLQQQQQQEAVAEEKNLLRRSKRFKPEGGGSKTRKNKKSIKKFIKTRKNKKNIKKNTKKNKKNKKNIHKSRK